MNLRARTKKVLAISEGISMQVIIYESFEFPSFKIGNETKYSRGKQGKGRKYFMR